MLAVIHVFELLVLLVGGLFFIGFFALVWGGLISDKLRRRRRVRVPRRFR